MHSLRAPCADVLAKFLATQEDLSLTYEPAGITREKTPPRGYNSDHLRRRLGSGPALFERAVAALRNWEMFRQGWVRLESGGRAPDLGLVVGVVVRVGPVWWWNACRVVYLIDENAPVRRV